MLADHHLVGSVAVVGHRPRLHELVSYLLTGDTEGASVQIKKGGVVRLQFEGYPEPGSASLRWLATPKILRACAPNRHGTPRAKDTWKTGFG